MITVKPAFAQGICDPSWSRYLFHVIHPHAFAHVNVWLHFALQHAASPWQVGASPHCLSVSAAICRAYGAGVEMKTAAARQVIQIANIHLWHSPCQRNPSDASQCLQC